MTEREHNAPRIIGNRYQVINRLGAGSLGTVYKVKDRLTGHIVALKIVTELSGDDLGGSHGNTQTVRIALAREFKTLASLRHPNIINVLDYGFDLNEAKQARQPYYTMDYLSGAKPLTKAGSDQPLSLQIDLLIQLLYALSYLYRRGILHRDLKPANVLVVMDDDQHPIVKVLDFSLAAILNSHKRLDETGDDVAAGTLAYMAPEVLQGTDVGPAADLHAVGLMGYEIINGAHPYDTYNIARLIQAIVNDHIDVNVLDLNTDLQGVFAKLLAKEPVDRYQTADEVINAFRTASDITESSRNTQEIQRAFLEAASFVGRDAEYAHFSGAVQGAVFNSNGSAWLIGGESGVGKSRLLEEIRTMALVDGILVLSGQAMSTGALLYSAWRSVVRRLILQVTISDEVASVLRVLVPDIETLLERQIPKVESLDPHRTQVRLVQVVSELVDHFLQISDQPIVILLEDLHHSEGATLRLLDHLASRIDSQKMVIFATYRDDQKPDLPQELPHMTAFKLERLADEHVVELSASMIGEGVNNPGVVDLVRRASEGNVYFMIEVMRALIEEAGDIDQIGASTLPHNVFAEGISQVIRRRLDRVPDWGQDLLQVAAVYGRRIDLNLLRHIAPDIDHDTWITACVTAAVFTAGDSGNDDTRWRFAHDKLREALLDEIADDALPDLHRRVAEGLESVHSDTRVVAPQLAHHWRRAHDDFRELLYRGMAGREAIRNSANDAAVRHFARALELLKRDHILLPDKAQQELNLQLGMGGALMTLRGYASTEVESAFGRARELAEASGDPTVTLQTLASLSGYYITRAEYRTVYAMRDELLALAQQVNSPVQHMWAHVALGQAQGFMGNLSDSQTYLEYVVQHYDHTIRKKSIKRSPIQDIGVLAYEMLAMVYWQMGYADRALATATRALEIAYALEHPITIAFALHWTGNLYHFRGDYETCLRLANDTVALAEDQEFAYFTALGTMWQGIARSHIEQRFDDDILQQMQRGLNGCLETGAMLGVPFFMANMARTRSFDGQTQDALEEIDEALVLVARTHEKWIEPELHRLRGEFLAMDDGNNAQAESAFIHARDLAIEQGAWAWALRAATSLAMHWIKQGRDEDARAQLRPIMENIREGYNTVDVQSARALLDD